LPEGLVLEGGDVVPFSRGDRRCLLVGYGPRTTRGTLDFLRDVLIPGYIDEIIGISLAPWRINLDGALVPVANDVVVAQPDSLLEAILMDDTGSSPVDVLELLRDTGAAILEVTVEESIHQQACNCLCLGDRKIICYDLCQRICDLLRAHEVRAFTVPGSELVKGRGGPRCMSRPIY
jgi:N-dimethylarginine dimethylaminohydrolase